MLLSLRTTKSTVRWKLFSRETAVSCSMCKKLCPLACKANTQHSQKHVCVCAPCMYRGMCAAVFPYTMSMCECVCGRMEGHCHHYLSNTSLLGKRERRGGATQSCCRERRGKDKKGLLDEVIQLHCTSVERRWRGRREGRKTWREWEMEGGGGSLWPHFTISLGWFLPVISIKHIWHSLFFKYNLMFGGVILPRMTSASTLHCIIYCSCNTVHLISFSFKLIFKKSFQASNKPHTLIQTCCKLHYFASYSVSVNKAGANWGEKWF